MKPHDRMEELLRSIVEQAEEDLAITRAMNLAPLVAMAEDKDPEVADAAKRILTQRDATEFQKYVAKAALLPDKDVPYFMKGAQKRHEIRINAQARNSPPHQQEPDVYILPVGDKVQDQLDAIDPEEPGGSQS